MAGGMKINWVEWNIVCQLKADDDPRVRDMRVVNLSFSAKWGQMLLQGIQLLRMRCYWRNMAKMQPN